MGPAHLELTVDPVADPKPVLLGIEMDVGRPRIESALEDLSHQVGQGGGGGQGGSGSGSGSSSGGTGSGSVGSGQGDDDPARDPSRR